MLKSKRNCHKRLVYTKRQGLASRNSEKKSEQKRCPILYVRCRLELKLLRMKK